MGGTEREREREELGRWQNVDVVVEKDVVALPFQKIPCPCTVPRTQLRNTSISRITGTSNIFLFPSSFFLLVAVLVWRRLGQTWGTGCLYVEKQCPRMEELFLCCKTLPWSENAARV